MKIEFKLDEAAAGRLGLKCPLELITRPRMLYCGSVYGPSTAVTKFAELAGLKPENATVSNLNFFFFLQPALGFGALVGHSGAPGANQGGGEPSRAMPPVDPNRGLVLVVVDVVDFRFPGSLNPADLVCGSAHPAIKVP